MEDFEILEINGFEYVLLAKLEYNHKNYILCAKVIDDQDVADELEIFIKAQNGVTEILDFNEYNMIKEIFEKQMNL